jgi:two-component system cell cycle response regulator
MKALIVDDEVGFRKLLSLMLRKRAYEIIEVSNGVEAWEILQREKIQLVLTDWVMPDMDGVELTRRIREANFDYYVYIILLTARTSTQDIIAGLEAGADDYIIKPFDVDELRARLTISERILGLERKLRDTLSQMREMAMHDSLTGTFNRRAIYGVIEEELSRSKREEKPLSLILMDIDHFKNVNDQFGHAAGDEALRQVAQALKDHIRPYDCVARWGGEEFLVVVPGSNLEETKELAERLRIAVATLKIQVDEGELFPLNGSFGVTTAKADSDVTIDRLVQRADEVMYLAKEQGRNRVCALPLS